MSYKARYKQLLGILSEWAASDRTSSGTSGEPGDALEDLLAGLLSSHERSVRDAVSDGKVMGMVFDKMMAKIQSNGESLSDRNSAYQLCSKVSFNALDLEAMCRIGSGSFATVDAVACKHDRRIYALKSIKKSHIRRAGAATNAPLERNIHLLSAAKQTCHTPPLIASFQTPSSLHLLLPYAPCGTLWDLFSASPAVSTRSQLSLSSSSPLKGRLGSEERQCIPAETLKFYLAQVVLALEWLHIEIGVVHRDVKPQNILLRGGGVEGCSRIWLTDFGSAAVLPPNPSHTTSPGEVWPKPRFLAVNDCCLLYGTPDYIPPEIFRSYEHHQASFLSRSTCSIVVYESSVDWWSFGIMAYELSEWGCGRPPFWREKVEDTWAAIAAVEEEKGGVDFDGQGGFELKELIRVLVVPEKRRLGRLGPEEIKRHHYFLGTDWDSILSGKRPPDVPLPPEIQLEAAVDSFGVTNTLGTNSAFKSLSDSYSGAAAGSRGWMHELDAHVGGWDGGDSSVEESEGEEEEVEEKNLANKEEDEWIGWTYCPPRDFFESAPFPDHPNSTLASSANRPPSLPHFTSFLTPARNPSNPLNPGTVPRSNARLRPVSDRRALKDLEACVKESARKKVEASGGRVGGWESKTKDLRQVGGVAVGRVPDTPTPASREMSVRSGSASLRSRSREEVRLATPVGSGAESEVGEMEERLRALRANLTKLEQSAQDIRSGLEAVA